MTRTEPPSPERKGVSHGNNPFGEARNAATKRNKRAENMFFSLLTSGGTTTTTGTAVHPPPPLGRGNQQEVVGEAEGEKGGSKWKSERKR